MKSFILKLERHKEFESNPYRRYVGVIYITSIFLIVIFNLYSGLYWQAGSLLFLALTALPEFYKMAKNNYTNEVSSVGECVLEFRENKIVCKYKNKIIWSLPFNKISHIETQPVGTGKWVSPKTKETYIYSNVSPNDTYPLPGSISETDKEIIAKELESVKS